MTNQAIPTAKTLNPLVPPVILMSFALLAGTKHLIHYFEGASRGGLLLSGALGSAGTLYFDHKCTDERETLLGRTIAIALGTLTAYIASKGLGGRVSLSLSAAVKFTLFEAALVAPASCSTTQRKQTPHITPQEKHKHYKAHPHEWRSLSPEKRAELVNEFYQNNLPVISLKNLKLDLQTLDIDLLNPTCPEWAVEVLLTQDNLRFLEELEYNPSADYSFLADTLFDHFPELAFFLNPEKMNPVSSNLYPLIHSLKGRIQSAQDVNNLSINQLRGYHLAFQKRGVNYKNQGIHQAFLTRFRACRLSTQRIRFIDELSFTTSQGEEMKVSELSKD